MNTRIDASLAKQAQDRRPAVAEKVEGLFSQLESLHSLLGVLEDRLHPISSPGETLNGTAVSTQTIPVLSPMARQLEEAAARTYEARQRIELILQRLEV